MTCPSGVAIPPKLVKRSKSSGALDARSPATFLGGVGNSVFQEIDGKLPAGFALWVFLVFFLNTQKVNVIQ